MLGGDVLALLDSLGIESVDYAGISLGGLVGQWLAVHASDRIRRVVLANTAACIGTRDHWDARIDAVTAHGMSSIADAAMQRWFSAGFITRNPEQVDAFKKILVGTLLTGTWRRASPFATRTIARSFATSRGRRSWSRAR